MVCRKQVCLHCGECFNSNTVLIDANVSKGKRVNKINKKKGYDNGLCIADCLIHVGLLFSISIVVGYGMWIVTGMIFNA